MLKKLPKFKQTDFDTKNLEICKNNDNKPFFLELNEKIHFCMDQNTGKILYNSDSQIKTTS